MPLNRIGQLDLVSKYHVLYKKLNIHVHVVYMNNDE